MADNVEITAGTGTRIATDEVTRNAIVEHQQIMKIGLGAEGAHDLVLDSGQQNMAGSLPVALASDSLVAVTPGPKQVRISVTPTIDTGIYATGDCIGGLMEFTNAARVSGGSGIVQSILVLDKTQAQRAAIDLLFFDRTVTVAGNNVVVAMSDGDLAYFLGLVSIGPYNTVWPGTPLNSASTLMNVGLPFVLSGTSIFVQAVVRATPTYIGVSDLVFTLGILQD